MKSSPFKIPRKTRSGIPESCLESLIGLKFLEKKYQDVAGGNYRGKEFLKIVLNSFGVKHDISSGDLDSIPSSGPAVVVANHPFGGIEGVAMADMLLSVRNDVKVLTNEMLCRIPDLQDIFIGVDLLGKDRREKNKKAILEAQNWVSSGHLLLIFPAGEVSSYDRKAGKITDPKWRLTAARIVRNTSACVIPVFIEGSNGWLFQALGVIHPALRTLRLVRELINKKGSTIKFRVGTRLNQKNLGAVKSEEALTNYFRLHTYLLSTRDKKSTDKLPNEGQYRVEKIIPAIAKNLLERDVRLLPDDKCLLKKGDMDVYCAEAKYLPHILKEIGRLREVSFRRVGEGTGLSLDIDDYDKYYLHLFVWNKKESEIIGAYRIGKVDEIMREHGIHGIYSRSLFRYHSAFLQRLGTCLEMGRSFVRPEYQKSLSALLLLWKGIGAFVSQNPKYRVLFGPVSISSEYSDVSRHLMAGCLEVNNSDKVLRELVQPKMPLKNKSVCFWKKDELTGLDDIDQLSFLISQIEKDEKGIPVLLRQYLKLQGELAAFNIDPEFNSALDGLIIVDLSRVDIRTLYKYMGEEQAEKFLNYKKSAA